MSVYLEMQIEELEDEITDLKAINKKLQLEKNVLKEQLNLGVVSQRSELLPNFLSNRNDKIYVNVYEDADVTIHWNEYLKIR